MKLGKSLGEVCKSLAKDPSPRQVMEALQLTSQLENRAREMGVIREKQLVPYVAAHIATSQQKRFNNKVRGDGTS